jgi:hypothetical protein
MKELFNNYRSQSFQDFEIITVIDSMTTDDSIDVCTNFADGVYVVDGSKTGRDMGMCALMRNYGSSKAQGDVLLHTDSDICFSDSSQLERMTSYFIDNNLDIMSARRLHEEGNLFNSIVEALRGLYPSTVVPLFIKKEVFNQIGGYLPTVLHDIRLGSAARQYGFYPRLIQETVVNKRHMNGVV